MPFRVAKSTQSKKTSDRKALARFIHEFGFEMPSCDSCRRRGLECVVAEGKERCAECVSAGYTSCNPGGNSAAACWSFLSILLTVRFLLISFIDERVVREKDRLSRERAAAEEDLERAMAKLQRIRRQEKFLREKAAEMIRRGVESLDELDSQERIELESQMITHPPEFLAEIGLPVPDEYWSVLPGETSLPAVGSSSSVS
jgi:hypothetical protein